MAILRDFFSPQQLKKISTVDETEKFQEEWREKNKDSSLDQSKDPHQRWKKTRENMKRACDALNEVKL